MRGSRPSGSAARYASIIGFWISASDRSGAPIGRGCVRESMRPSPAAPARRAPSTVNVACQMRSTRLGFVGYSRSPPGSGRPAQASRRT